MPTYRFIKEPAGWFIDLPAFLEQGGSKGDLEMVSGADTLLDIIAAGSPEVTLQINIAPFENADELNLTEECDPFLGGGYYFIRQFEQQTLGFSLWLCDVTRFVFGSIPEKIYIKRFESGIR